MGILGNRERQRTRGEDWAETIDLLRRTEEDAALACTLAAEALRDEPLTRGALLSFRAEHEQHRAALAALATPLPRMRGKALTGIAADAVTFANARGSLGVLAVIRKNAELAVRRYRAALESAPPGFVETIRAQCNVWLRHRAWLTARIDAFARTRDSLPPP